MDKSCNKCRSGHESAKNVKSCRQEFLSAGSLNSVKNFLGSKIPPVDLYHLAKGFVWRRQSAWPNDPCAANAKSYLLQGPGNKEKKIKMGLKDIEIKRPSRCCPFLEHYWKFKETFDKRKFVVWKLGFLLSTTCQRRDFLGKMSRLGLHSWWDLWCYRFRLGHAQLHGCLIGHGCRLWLKPLKGVFY